MTDMLLLQSIVNATHLLERIADALDRAYPLAPSNQTAPAAPLDFPDAAGWIKWTPAPGSKGPVTVRPDTLVDIRMRGGVITHNRVDCIDWTNDSTSKNDPGSWEVVAWRPHQKGTDPK